MDSGRIRIGLTTPRVIMSAAAYGFVMSAWRHFRDRPQDFTSPPEAIRNGVVDLGAAVLWAVCATVAVVVWRRAVNAGTRVRFQRVVALGVVGLPLAIATVGEAVLKDLAFRGGVDSYDRAGLFLFMLVLATGIGILFANDRWKHVAAANGGVAQSGSERL